MRDSIDVRIDGISSTGAGVGRAPDGRAVFVQRTAPGELVRVRLTEQKSRWARGRLVHVLEPSTERRDAPCVFYDRCGGCTLEHMQYDAQLDVKARIVADTLGRIGGIVVDPPPVTASPEQMRYRNRVSFTLVRLPGDRVVAGFHELNRPDRVVDIDERCLMAEAPVAETWGQLRHAWAPGASRLPSGDRLRLTVRASAAGRTALLVQGGYGAGRAGELLPRVERLDSVWHQPDGAPATTLLAGRDHLLESWQGEELELGGAVFLQVNRATAALLEAHVMTLAGDVSGCTVIDAYCGVGLHARRLARLGARVTGVELDAHAVREAARSPTGAHYIVGRVESVLPDLLPADLLLINPPRTGVDIAVIDTILSQPPARVIYISCDPATLARDLKRLAPTYDVRSIRCFDMFPQTAHVETVVELACSIM